MYWLVEGTANTHLRSIIRFFALLIYAFLCSKIRWPTILHVRLVSRSLAMNSNNGIGDTCTNATNCVWFLLHPRTERNYSFLACDDQLSRGIGSCIKRCNETIKFKLYAKSETEKSGRGEGAWGRPGTMVLFVVHFVFSA